MQVVGYIYCYLMQPITSHNFENSMVLHCTAQLCSKTKNSPLPLENQRVGVRLGTMALSPVIPIGHMTDSLTGPIVCLYNLTSRHISQAVQ